MELFSVYPPVEGQGLLQGVFRGLLLSGHGCEGGFHHPQGDELLGDSGGVHL